MFADAGADPSLVVFDYLEVKPAGGDAATPRTPRRCACCRGSTRWMPNNRTSSS